LPALSASASVKSDALNVGVVSCARAAVASSKAAPDAATPNQAGFSMRQLECNGEATRNE
jgi:hypothetical protein